MAVPSMTLLFPWRSSSRKELWSWAPQELLMEAVFHLGRDEKAAAVGMYGHKVACLQELSR
jgi:hypothetical protein